jgi:hypothetical protein
MLQGLRVHLQDEQMVQFTEGQEEEAVERESARKTELTGFFDYNAANNERRYR